MKTRDLLEAANVKVWYVEFYPHYMAGDLESEVVMSMQELETLAQQVKHLRRDARRQAVAQRRQGGSGEWTDTPTYQEHVNFLKQLESRAKHNEGKVSVHGPYALLNLFNEHDPDTVLRKLRRTGLWSGEWEEGSFALSTKGSKPAWEAIEKIEAKHREEQDEDF